MHAERGFTLIEILVVLIIIGITLGFALLAFGDFGASRSALVSAEQFSSYLQLLQERAIIEANAFGVSLHKTGYSTYRFREGSWQAMPAKSIFHPRTFPNKVTVSMHMQIKNRGKNPDIIIDSVGDMTEFSMDFGTAKQPKMVILVGRPHGKLLIEHAPKHHD